MKPIIPVLVAVIVALSGCASALATKEAVSTEVEGVAEDSVPAEAGASAEGTASYQQISQEEAKEMMAREDGHVIVDVRRQDEYDAGHIPGAILIPNESIGQDSPEALPDHDQIILIYCRSGNRSKQAAQKLAAMGYKNIYEFGGINTWTGEIVTEDSETAVETAESPENVAEENLSENEVVSMKMKIGETEVPVTWEENASVEALRQLLPITVQMSMYGGFEQVGSLGQSIVRDDRQTTTDYGDIVLYSGNQIVVFYGSNSWSYTRLGHVELSQEEMTDLLGKEDVVIMITED